VTSNSAFCLLGFDAALVIGDGVLEDGREAVDQAIGSLLPARRSPTVVGGQRHGRQPWPLPAVLSVAQEQQTGENSALLNRLTPKRGMKTTQLFVRLSRERAIP
jgi:hypothetical protein